MKTRRISPAFGAVILIVAVFAAWEIAPRIFDLPPAFVTTPSAAITDMIERPDRYIQATIDTVLEFLPALCIAGGGGVLLGLVLGTSSATGRFLRSYVAALYAVPLVMLYPLLTAWMGLDSTTRIVFGGIYGLIPVTLTVAATVSSIDWTWMDTGRAMGASRWQVLFKIVFPMTLPGIFSGLKIGGGLAFVGVIIGQLLGSNRGLGFLLSSSRTSFDVDGLYAAVILVLLIALLLNVLLSLLQRGFAPWATPSAK